jgi:peroxiredoxin
MMVIQVVGQVSPLAGPLTIKGKINGVLSGTVSVTTEVFGEKQTFNAPISQGRFEMKINQPSPTLYSLSVEEDPDGRIMFFADNGIVQIDANKGDIGNASVTGSVSHKEFTEYNVMVSNYDFLLNTINGVWLDLERKGQLLPKMDSLRKVYARTEQKKDSSITTWLTHHNKSFVSPLIMILNYANDGEAAAMRKMFNGLSADVKKSYYGNFIDGIIVQKEELAARLEKLNIGKVAPAFSQTDPNGEPISLESFRGKYVLIDFWASWCRPCREENPNVVRTYEKFKGKNFEILGVSLDNNKSRWLEAIKEDQLTWAQVSDLKYWRNAVAVQYGVQSIPANFLIDRQGKIVAKGLRGPALEATLERLLSQNN